MGVTPSTRSERLLDAALVVVGLAMVLYQLVQARLIILGSFENQIVHLAFVFAMMFLGAARTVRSRGNRIVQVALALLGVAAAAYVYARLEHLEEVVGFPDPPDVAVGVVLAILAIEGTRRAWGWALPIVAIASISYFLFGHWLPNPLHHREFDLSYVVSYLSVGMSGIFGTFLSISANEIFLFVVFGSLMGLMGLDAFLYELGKLVGRRLSGGAGHTAVVASTFMGMVTGAAVANVAITGSFTIPYMKQAGYRPALAGAIEATASTGSQVMPPVMGAAAFLMAFFIGVPYSEVMVAAIVPAILFYMTVMFGVQFVAVADGISARPEPVDKWAILRGLPMFAIPVAVIAVLLMLHLSPALAAFWAIASVLVLSLFRPGARPGIAEVVRRAAQGAVVGAQIGIALAAVGMIAQTLIATGLGAKIAGLVVTISDGSILAALVLTMLVTLVLGCGVPAVAAYSLVAIVVAPSLVRMGVPVMAAHFFCFYFAMISAITPPVGLAALAAAGIAKASYLETGVAAFKLAIAGFVIPFLVIFNPVLNLQSQDALAVAGSLVSIPLGLVALTSALYGVALDRLGPAQRAAMTLAAILLIAYALSWHAVDGAASLALLALGVASFTWVLHSQARSRIAARRVRLAA